MFNKPRHEQKYLISNHDAYILKQKLSFLLCDDANGSGENGYEVTSLYFDTPNFSCAQEKEDGLYERSKYRLRTYNKGGTYNFEVKKKMGEACLKEICRIDKQMAYSLCNENGNGETTTNPLLSNVLSLRKSGLLKPAVIVRYKRRAFCGEPGRIRITFDEDLCAIAPKKSSDFSPVFYSDTALSIPVLPIGFCILEVKYDEFLSDAVKTLISLPSRPRMSLSKYLYCLRAIQLQ